MFYDVTNDGIVVRVRLSPNSSCCRVGGIFTDAEGYDFLKISVVSVPDKGKANREFLAYFSNSLKIAKTFMEIVSGEFDRYKKVKIIGDSQELAKKVEKLVAGEKDDGTNY